MKLQLIYTCGVALALATPAVAKTKWNADGGSGSAESSTSKSKWKVDSAPAAPIPAPAATDSSVSKAVTLDNFDANNWSTAKGDGTEIKTSVVSVPGKENKALQIDYDLKDSKQWVAISKEIPIPNYNGKAIQFYVKAEGDKTNNLEVKLVDEDGTNYGNKFALHPNGKWQQVTLDVSQDFTYWWGGNKTLDGVKWIYFAISAGEGGSGTVSLSDLGLASSGLVSSAKKSAAKVKAGSLDDCESTSGWASSSDQGSTAKLSSIPGKTGNALGLEYDLNGGNWVQINKDFALEATPQSALRFDFKWTGDNNMLEVKLIDKDGSNFGKKIEFPGKAGEWQTVRVPLAELAYWWGGADKELDWNNIQALWLGVSRNKGSKGTIAFDNFELVQQ